MVAKRKITAEKPAEQKGLNAANEADAIVQGIHAEGTQAEGVAERLVACIQAGQIGLTAIEMAAKALAEETRVKADQAVQASSDLLKRLRANLRKACLKIDPKGKVLTVVVLDRKQNIWKCKEAVGIQRKPINLADEKVQEAFAADQATKFSKHITDELKARGVEDRQIRETVLLEAIIDLAVMLQVDPAELADILEQRYEAMPVEQRKVA